MIGVLRIIHRWLGLVLALPLLLQGISGALLALEPVLPEWSPPGTVAGEHRDAGAIIDAARAVAAPGLRAARYVPASGPGDAARVHFVPRTGPVRGGGVAVRIDPVTLAVLGLEADAGGALGWIKAWHTDFLTTDRTGRSVVGWLGVGLLVLSVAGVALWWPAWGRWRAAFTVARGASGWVLHRRLHGAVGAWSLGLLLATATTGVMLAFPQTMRSALGLSQAAPPRRAQGAADMASGSLKRAVELAGSVAPGARVRLVVLPARDGDPLRVLFVPFGDEGVAAITTVAVDPSSLRILSVQDPRSLSLAETALRWAHDLHFGQGFGPIWRVLTIASGLVLPVFAVTGCAMWLTRRRSGRRNPARRAVTQAGE